MADRRRRAPRLPTPGTLRRQVVLEEHDLAPDGSFAVVSRRVVEGEHYTSSLWLVPIAPDGRGRRPVPRRLTHGEVRDTRPAISPDGRRVAFSREMPRDDDAPASLQVIDLLGGEPLSAPHRRAVGARARVVAGRPADRVHRQDGPAAVHRRTRAEGG